MPKCFRWFAYLDKITYFCYNLKQITMRTFKTILTALVVMLGVVACTEDAPSNGNETKTPVIKFQSEIVEIDYDGAEVLVDYTIEFPVKGESVVINNTAEWLTVEAVGNAQLKFTAVANDAEAERKTDVVVSYKGAESVTLKVTQDYNAVANSPIAIKFVAADHASVTVDIVTADPELTWIPMITYKEYFDEYTSDDEIFASDMEYFEYLADMWDYTLAEFIEEMVGVGTEEGLVIEDLEPSTEYVVYAYGVSLEGERTTDIVSLAITTAEPYDGDLTFEISAVEEDFSLSFTITPSHKGVGYMYGIATEAQINEWKELAGSDNLRDAIQLGDIEAGIADLMDYGLVEERSDYYDIFSESDVMDYGWEELKAATKYIIYAAKWNENCEIVGEVATYEHTSASVEASDNVITVEISEITQSSVTVTTTTSNYDDYVVLPVRASEVEELNDEEAFAFVMGAYEYLVSEYTYYSDICETYTRMRPETNYTLLVFGCQAGIQTTAMQRVNFTTLASGDPKECTFDIEVMDIESDCAWVEITPSDKGHYYHWMAYPASFTADEVKAVVTDRLENTYEGDVEAFSSWELSQGDEETTVWDLIPNTEYKIGLIIMDYDTGEFLSDVVFGEVFKTPEVVYADITFDVQFGKYFDIDALVAAGYTQFEGEDYAGQAIMSIDVAVEGECSEFYYDIYNNDLSDTVKYPDAIFYEGLWYGMDASHSMVVLDYDTVMTFVAVGYDYSYEPSALYRKVFTLTKDGASPVEEFGAEASVARSMVIAPEQKSARVERKFNKADYVYTSEFVAKSNEAMASIKSERRANAEKEVALRLSAKSKAKGCRIAR